MARHLLKNSLIIVLAVLLAACGRTAVKGGGQGAAAPVPVPPAAAAAPGMPEEAAELLGQCRIENIERCEETIARFKRVRAVVRAILTEIPDLSTREDRLRTLQRQLTRGGLTLAECRRIEAVLKEEQEYIRDIAAGPALDPSLALCRAENQKGSDEVARLFRKVRAEKRFTVAEAGVFVEREKRFRAVPARLAGSGLTLAECRRLSALIANERAFLSRMLTGRESRSPQR